MMINLQPLFLCFPRLKYIFTYHVIFKNLIKNFSGLSKSSSIVVLYILCIKSFIGRKKHKIRGRSNNEDKTKQKKDSRLDESKPNALCSNKDVFTEEFKITEWRCYSVLL